MLKRIDVKHLLVGMYLHELCGKYIDHPFWRTKFKLEDTHAIEQLLASPIKEVVIDTDKGLDIAADQPHKPVSPTPKPAPTSNSKIAHASLKQEIAKGAKRAQAAGNTPPIAARAKTLEPA